MSVHISCFVFTSQHFHEKQMFLRKGQDRQITGFKVLSLAVTRREVPFTYSSYLHAFVIIRINCTNDIKGSVMYYVGNQN